MGVQLKFPADSDKEVNASDNNKVAGVTGFTWGAVYKEKFCERLAGDPISVEKPEGVVATQPKPKPTAKPKQRVKQGGDIGQSMAYAGMVGYNSTVSANMKLKDYDMFRIDFAGGQFLCYSLGELDLVADLVDANGKTIARDDNSGSGRNFRFNRYLAPGTYGIQVRVMYHGGRGNYKIVFGNGSKQLREANLLAPSEKMRIDQAFLGASVKSLEAQRAKSIGLPTGTAGVVVTQVVRGGPAWKSGLRASDVILKLGGERVRDASHLRRIVNARKPGDNIKAIVVSSVNIKLGKSDF